MSAWIKVSLSLMMLSTLAACAPAANVGLPDDPTREIIVENDEAKAISQAVASNFRAPTYSKSEQVAILAQYEHLDPTQVIPDALLEKAVLYFHANKSSIGNKSVLAVIDFSKHSSKKRFHFVNLKTGAVWSTYMAHGKGSDGNHDGYATDFSNKSGSQKSSLGFYLSAETYNGDNGRSMRLDGLSSTNSIARARAIVVHGASYVKLAAVKQGRSWGCPAVAQEVRDKVLELLKGKTLIYAGLTK